VSRSRISELIKQHGPLPAPGPLFGDTEAAGADPAARDGDDTASGQHAGGDGAGTAGQPAGGGTGTGTRGSGDDRTGTRARAGGWRGGSSPGLLPAGMRARCWYTPSRAGSAPGAC